MMITGETAIRLTDLSIGRRRRHPQRVVVSRSGHDASTLRREHRRPQRRPAVSVPGVDVDDADQLLTAGESADVLRHPLREQRHGHLRGVADVRGDDAVGQRPQRVPGGKRFGVGHVERSAADHAVAQRVDEIVGDDVPAAGDVDDPGVRLHQREFLGTEHGLGLRRQREGEHDEIGAGESVGVAVGLEHVVDAVHRLDVGAHDGDPAVPRPKEPYERLGDAAAAEDGHVAVEEIVPGRAGPLLGAGVGTEIAQSGQAEGERHLGHRFGVDPLAAGPDPVVIELADEVLDPGEGQLHPADPPAVVERLGEGGDIAGVAPHDRLGLVDVDEVPTTGDDRVGQPLGSGVGAEMDAGCLTVGHLRTNRSGRGGHRSGSGGPRMGHDVAMSSPSPVVRTVGVPREIKTAEHRVAMTPDGVRELERHGVAVLVEAGAGEGASITDDDYVAAGAEIVPTAADAWAQEMVVKVKEPQVSEFGFLRDDLTLFTYLHLAAYPEVAAALLAARTTAVAYETVQMSDRSLPLLAPMSEVAGRLAPQMGAHYLERHNGGRGVLMGGAPGVRPAKVVVLGAGNVGWNAAWIAAGMEAEVVLVDKNLDRLRFVDQIHRGRIMTAASNRGAIERAVADADLVIGAVLVAGDRAPVVVTEEMVQQMKPRSVIVDVAVDQGGCIATTRETTHDQPTYVLHDVVHYAVGNMPGAVPHTSTYALTNATLPFQLTVALHGALGAAKRDPAIGHGLNTVDGEYANATVAEALGATAVEPLGPVH
jgi:alanine dehydrogenase